MHVQTTHPSLISSPRSVSAPPVKVAPAPTAPSLLDDPATARMLRKLDPALAAQGVAETLKEAADGDPAMHPQMQALIDAWGTSDPDFDLDGDGVVGFSDLLLMMEKLAGQPDPEEESVKEEAPAPVDLSAGEAEEETPPSSNGATVDGLLRAWGSPSPQFDLNGSGNVDMSDLFQMLSNLNAGQSDAAPGAVTVPGTGGQMDASAPIAATPAESLAELLRSWSGSNPSGTGAAGSGNGSMANLFEILNQMNAPSGGAAALTTRPAPTAPSMADRAVNKLLTNFREQGFGSTPPINVDEIINGLDFGAEMKRSVMSKLAAAYPQGLGVQMLA